MLLTAFVLIEERSENPLVRLGILRSTALRRANYGAMALLGNWFGFQFIGTLYMQNLRGWSPIEMALAFLPAGLITLRSGSQIGRLVDRVGPALPVGAGLTSLGLAYLLFWNIGADSTYLTAMLPTFILSGIGFTLAFGPLTIAATADVGDDEQGLASGSSTPRSNSGSGWARGGDGGDRRRDVGISGGCGQLCGAARRLPPRDRGLDRDRGLGAAVTLIPLLGRFVLARVAVATSGDQGDARDWTAGAAGLGSAAPSREPPICRAFCAQPGPWPLLPCGCGLSSCPRIRSPEVETPLHSLTEPRFDLSDREGPRDECGVFGLFARTRCRAPDLLRALRAPASGPGVGRDRLRGRAHHDPARARARLAGVRRGEPARTRRRHGDRTRALLDHRRRRLGERPARLARTMAASWRLPTTAT